MEVKAGLTNPKISTNAKRFMSFDNELAHIDEIWQPMYSLNDKPAYIADVDVIEMFKTLSKLPMVNKRPVIPHPTKTDNFLDANEFVEVTDKTIFDDSDSMYWTLTDDETYLVLVKR